MAAAGPRVFGAAPLEVRRLRLAGRSPAQIGRRHGRSPSRVLTAARRVLRSYAARGVRSQATPPAQARRYLRLQLRTLPHWLITPIRKPGARARAPVYGRRTLRPRSRLLCFLFSGRKEVRPRGRTVSGR